MGWSWKAVEVNTDEFLIPYGQLHFFTLIMEKNREPVLKGVSKVTS